MAGRQAAARLVAQGSQAGTAVGIDEAQVSSSAKIRNRGQSGLSSDGMIDR